MVGSIMHGYENMKRIQREPAADRKRLPALARAPHLIHAFARRDSRSLALLILLGFVVGIAFWAVKTGKYNVIVFLVPGIVSFVVMAAIRAVFNSSRKKQK